MHYEHKRVIDLTDDELEVCRSLSFGDEGYMCEDLDRILTWERQRRYRYSYAVLAKITPHSNRPEHIVGWALIQPYPYTTRYTAQLFVDPAFRRRGIGGRLLSESNRYGSKPYVYVDEENEDFFRVFPELSTEY